jgi:hypothetical protein
MSKITAISQEILKIPVLPQELQKKITPRRPTTWILKLQYLSNHQSDLPQI